MNSARCPWSAGNSIPTNTIPLRVDRLYEDANISAAFAVGSVLAVLAVFTLIFKSILEWKQRRRSSRCRRGLTAVVTILQNFKTLPRIRRSRHNAPVAKRSQQKSQPVTARRKTATVRATIIDQAATLAEKQELEAMAPIDGVTVTVLANSKSRESKPAGIRCRQASHRPRHPRPINPTPPSR